MFKCWFVEMRQKSMAKRISDKKEKKKVEETEEVEDGPS